jgi:hypothetical protein
MEKDLLTDAIRPWQDFSATLPGFFWGQKFFRKTGRTRKGRVEEHPANTKKLRDMFV